MRLPKINKSAVFPLLIFFLVVVIFSWKFFFKGLVPIPTDVIVGIYYPWRDHLWSGYPAGVPIKNGLISDVVSIIYPWRIYGMDLLKQGVAPLWIPHALGGAPLLANFQSGILYPLNFLFFLLSNINAWSVYIIFQPFLASLFCYLYLRNLKLSNFSSIAGGLIFAFSGFMMVWFEYGVVGHAGLWLPLILLSVDKVKEMRGGRWIAFGAIAVAFSVLAGYPQITIYVLAISVTYIFYKKSFLSLLFLLLGILLSSVQILPGVELLRDSIRQTDPTAASFSSGIIPLKNLILGLAPDFFGNPVTGNWWGWAAYNETSFYIGISGLVFALMGLFFSKKGNFFKVVLGLSLLLAFNTPLAHFFQNLGFPGLASSSAGRFLFVTDFCLAILAAFGVEELFKNRSSKKILTILLSLGMIFAVVWFYVIANNSINPSLSVSKRNLLLPSGLFLATVFVFTLRHFFFAKFNKIVLCLFFLLIIFDLFRFGWKYNPFTPRQFLYPETKLTNSLRQKDGIDRFVGLLPQSMWIPYDLFSPEGYDPMMVKRYSQLANQINESQPKLLESGSRWVRVNNFSSPLLDLLGVKYLLSYREETKTGWDPEYYKYPKERYELIFQEGKSQIYENKKSLPRAFLVHKAVTVPSDEEAMKLLISDNFDPGKTVILEENFTIKERQQADEKESVKIEKFDYLKNNFTAMTETKNDGFLVLSDMFYPGWKAFVNGRETKIYRADYTFRAVFVPQGEHEVRFVYEPVSFRIGGTLSLISFLFLVFLVTASILKNPKKK